MEGLKKSVSNCKNVQKIEFSKEKNYFEIKMQEKIYAAS